MAKVRLSVILAFPLGYAVTRFIHTSIGEGISGLSALNGPLLGLPVYLLLFLVGGVRVAVTHPVALKANWIFALTDGVSPRHYLSGLRKAVALMILAPAVLGLFAIYLVFWQWQEAVGHALFSLILGLVLLEVLFAGYRRVPFTVEQLPGKLKLKNYWPVYLIAYVMYVLSARALAHFLLVHPGFYPLLAAGAAGLAAVGRLLQQRLAGNARMQYEDRASPYLLTLKLDN